MKWPSFSTSYGISFLFGGFFYTPPSRTYCPIRKQRRSLSPLLSPHVSKCRLICLVFISPLTFSISSLWLLKHVWCDLPSYLPPTHCRGKERSAFPLHVFRLASVTRLYGQQVVGQANSYNLSWRNGSLRICNGSKISASCNNGMLSSLNLPKLFSFPVLLSAFCLNSFIVQ